jgi:ketosteroid isomerase-like protein
MAELTPEYLTGYFDAFSMSDFDRMAAYYHPEIVLTFPGLVMGGRYRGADTLKEMFRGVQDMFQGTLKFTCPWAAVVGDRGVVQWYTEGHPRQGGHYLNRGCVIWTFEGDQIIDFQDYIDTDIVTAFVPGPPPENVADLTAKAFHPAYRR